MRLDFRGLQPFANPGDVLEQWPIRGEFFRNLPDPPVQFAVVFAHDIAAAQIGGLCQRQRLDGRQLPGLAG